MLCCNDPDNGNFDGRLWGVEFGDGLKLSCCFSDWAPALAFDMAHEPKWIRISGRRFKIQSYRDWVGNWCWAAVRMDWEEAIRLVNFLKGRRTRRRIRSSGFKPSNDPYFVCEEGEERLYNVWHGDGKFTLNDARIMAE